MEKLIDLIKEWPKLSVVISGVFSAGVSVGSYGIYAEQCHAQTRENQKSIEQLIEFQRQVVKEKELEQKSNQAVMAERYKLCVSGVLKDKALCATVGVEIDD